MATNPGIAEYLDKIDKLLRQGMSPKDVAAAFHIDVKDVEKIEKITKRKTKDDDKMSFIEHARREKGLKAGWESFLKERDEASKKEKGRGAKWKTISSIFLSEGASDAVSKMFDKLHEKEKKEEKKEEVKEKPASLDPKIIDAINNTNRLVEGMAKIILVKRGFKAEIDEENRVRFRSSKTGKFAKESDASAVYREPEQPKKEKTSRLLKTKQGFAAAARNIVTNKNSSTEASKDIASSMGSFGKAQKKAVDELQKIVSELASSIKDLDKTKSAKENKVAIKNKMKELKLSLPENPEQEDKALDEILSLLHKQEDKEKEKTPIYNALAEEEDEKQAQLEDALYEALKKIVKDHPELFKGEGGGFGGIFTPGAARVVRGVVGGVKALGRGVKNVATKGINAVKGVANKVTGTGLKAAGEGAELATKEIGVATKAASVGGEVAGTATKVATKGEIGGKVIKLLSSKAGKIIGKSLAGAGIIFGAWDAVKHAAKGDWTGLALDATAIGGSTAELTGVGAAVGAPAAILASVTNVIRDGYGDIFGTPPEKDPNFKQNMDMAMETASGWVKEKLGAQAKKEQTKQLKPAAATTSVAAAVQKPVTPGAAAAAAITPAAMLANPAVTTPPKPSPQTTLKATEPTVGQQLATLNTQKQESQMQLNTAQTTGQEQQAAPVTVLNQNSTVSMPQGENEIRTNNKENTFNRLLAADVDFPFSAFNIG